MNRLFNYETGRYEIVPEELARDGLKKGLYGFSSKSKVKMRDLDGNVLELDSNQAVNELINPESNLSWYSEEQNESDNAINEASDQSGRAFAEGVADYYSLGAYEYAADALGVDEQEKIKLRREQNPWSYYGGMGAGFLSSFVKLSPKGGVAGAAANLIARPLRALGFLPRMVDRLGIELSKKIIGGAKFVVGSSKAAKGLGITEGAARGAIQGGFDAATVGLLQGIGEEVIGDEEFTSEAALARIGTHAYESGKIGSIFGGGIGATAAAVSKAYRGVNKSLDKYFKDYHSDTVSETALGKVHRNKTFLAELDDTDSIVFEPRNKATIDDSVARRPDQNIYYNSGGKFMEPDEIRKLDVIDLDGEFPSELEPYLAHNWKEISVSKKFKERPDIKALLKKELDLNSDPSIVKSYMELDNQYTLKKDYVSRLEKERALLIEKMDNTTNIKDQKSYSYKAKTIYDTLQREYKDLFRLKNLEEELSKKILGNTIIKTKDEIKSLIKSKDGIKINGTYYISNLKKLDDVNTYILGNPQIAASTDSILSLVGVSKGERNKLDAIQAKRMERGIKDIISTITNNKTLNMIKVGIKSDQSRHQAFREVLEDKLVKAEDIMSDVYEKSKDFIPNYESLVTVGKLRNRVQKKFDELIKKTNFKTIQDEAEVKFERDQMLSLFGDKPLDQIVKISDLRDLSIKMRQDGYKYSPVSATYMKIMPKASREIGRIFEDEFMKVVKKYDKNLYEMYRKAKTDYSQFINVKTTLDRNIAERVQAEKGIKFMDIASATLGAAATGEPLIGLAIAAGRRALPEFKALATIKLDDMNNKWYNEIENAADLFLSSGTSRLAIQGTAFNADLFKNYNESPYDIDYESEVENFYDDNGFTSEFLPKTSSNLINKYMLGKGIINDAMPKELATDKIKEVSTIPTYEHRHAARIQDLVKNPQKILKEIATGYITAESANILNTVYPSTKKLLAEKIIEKMNSVYLSPSQKSQLKKIFGSSMEPTLTAQGFSMLQSVNKKMDNQAGGNVSQRPFKKRASSETTDRERRNYR